MSGRDDDDLALAPFIRALREETAPADHETVAGTRERVLRMAARRARRPRFTFALALAAVLFGASVVWAVWSAALGELGDDGAPPTTRSDEPVPPHEAPVIAEPVSVDEPPPDPPPPPALTPVPGPVHAPSVQRDRGDSTRGETAGRADVPSEAEVPVDPAERSAYDHAEHLQFTAHDWPAAVDAWEAYLTSFPSGRYVSEARWNRAIALVRAERRAEAREALAPIAAGSLGGYRQREADSLLRALEDAAR